MHFPPAPACPQPPQIPDDLHGDLDDREDLKGGTEENANKEVERVVSWFGHVKVSQEKAFCLIEAVNLPGLDLVLAPLRVEGVYRLLEPVARPGRGVRSLFRLKPSL
jgi:hypothetical protein